MLPQHLIWFIELTIVYRKNVFPINPARDVGRSANDKSHVSKKKNRYKLHP